MKRIALAATLFAVLAPLSNGMAQGIVIQERPVPLEIISQHVKVMAHKPYVPLEDLARALGSSLEFDPDLGRYSVQPTENGILKLASRSSRRLHQPASARARGPRGVPPSRSEFRVGDWLVSKGIIIVGGKPHLPLADLGGAMNSTVERSPKGAWTLVPRRGAGAGLIGLSQRGIIIVGGQPPPRARR